MFALPPNNSSQSSTTFLRNFKISQSISLSTISGFLIHLFNKAYEKKGINLFWSVKKLYFLDELHALVALSILLTVYLSYLIH